MRQVNQNIIPVQTAATITTAAIPALNLFNASVQLVATGSAAGTLTLNASNDDFQEVTELPTNFSQIAIVTITGAGVYLIPKTDLCYQWVNIVYTNSGTGTISVVFKALGD